MKYIPILQKYGIKLTHIAQKLGMSESLLRYHLNQEPVDPDVEVRFLRALRDNSERLNKAIN